VAAHDARPLPHAEPGWETILDLDALSTAEKANWVYKGAVCLEPEQTRCLVQLSNGGKDAVEVREFDVTTRTFTPGGFKLGESKQDVTWEDADTLLVGRDWGPGMVTESGYPFIVKRLKRGQPLEAAVEVFRGEPTDVAVSAGTLRDPDGKLRAVTLTRAITFYESEQYLLGANGPVRLPVPAKSTMQAFVDGQLVFTLEEPWTHKGRSFPQGRAGQLRPRGAAARSGAGDATGVRAAAAGSPEQVASTRRALMCGVRGTCAARTLTATATARAGGPAPLQAAGRTLVGVVARDEDDTVRQRQRLPAAHLADLATPPRALRWS
jgi:prolyl oligopeptidase